jgi:hypothetical protein
MSERYAVRTRLVFEGEFYVDAESASEAKGIVRDKCHMTTCGGVQSDISGCDWKFPIHAGMVVVSAARAKEPEDG